LYSSHGVLQRNNLYLFSIAENGKQSDPVGVFMHPKIGHFISAKSSEDVQAQARKSQSQ
jgi:hypothetical protein